MTDPAVVVDDLRMSYGATVAVDGLSLAVERGSITAILGPNGAGKTTTLETCEGYRTAQSGTVRVLGHDPATSRRHLGTRVGVMLQSGGAWSGIRGSEILAYVASLYSNPLPVDPLARRLGIDALGATPYRRLSGGQQQRLALATAVVGRPELVFLDEPSAGLDPQARHVTWELIRSLAAAGVTVVLSTHHMEEAETLADQVYVIDHGRVIAEGTPDELTTSAPLLVIETEAPLDPAALASVLGQGCHVSAPTPVRLEVTGDVTPAALAQVASWLSEVDAMPTRLTLDRRSLEDVFLELTGREVRA